MENHNIPFHIIEDLYRVKKEWSAVDFIKEAGLRINNEDSILYNAAKNNIPVFVPGITDGSFGSEKRSKKQWENDCCISIYVGKFSVFPHCNHKRNA